jgi:PAS domain S-box-containing protein
MAQQRAAISTIHDAEVLMEIINNLPTSVFVKNDRLQFELSNQAHCDIIGLPAERLLGAGDADFYPASEAQGFLERDRAVLDSGETVEAIETATNQQGQTVPYFTRKSKLVTPGGKTYLIGTNTNLTEIRRREEQYRALAETVPVGIWQVGEDGTTSFANPLLLAYLGLARGDEAEIAAMLCPPDGQANFPGEAMRFETDITPRSGRPRRVLVASSGWLSLHSNDGRAALVSVADISEMNELKRVNDEISRLNRELADNMTKLGEAQDEIMRRGRMAQLGQLTATVAHEIRNPLGAVRTAAFLIERKVKDKGLGIEPQLSRIANGITRCDAIITQLLEFSRSRVLQTETLVLDDWLVQLVTEEAKALPEMVAVTCDLGLEGTTLAFDPTQLGRALINLLANASEAMVGKGDDPAKFACAAPAITVITSRTPRGIEIAVADNGPGIAPDHLRRILEPLFTTKSFGTGLGLPAAEKVAQEHGGGLEVSSEPGCGARFTMWLPLRRTGREAA